MKVLDRKINLQLELLLEAYKDWLWKTVIEGDPDKMDGFVKDTPEERETGPDALRAMMEFPTEAMLESSRFNFPTSFYLATAKHYIDFDDPKCKGNIIDKEIYNYVTEGDEGWTFAARHYYPPGGHMGWHDNHEVPGYNVMFTWSEKGDGFFRWVDGTEQKVYTIPDVPGWSCKYGYYGDKTEPHLKVPHCFENYDHRFTFGFATMDKKSFDRFMKKI